MGHKASATLAKMASATTAASGTEGQRNEVQAGIVLAATATEIGTAAAVIVGLEIEATAGTDDPAIEVTAGTGGQEIEVTAATDDREIEEIGTGVMIATEEIGNEEEETETVVMEEAANEEIEERLRGGLDRGADGPYLARKVTEGAATEAEVASNKNVVAARPTKTDRIRMEVVREAPGSGVALEQRQLACRRSKR